MGEIGEWSSGGTPSRARPDYYGGDIPWVKTGDLEDRVLLDTPEKITQAGLRNSSAKLFPSGTLLIAMYGATIGKTALLGIPAATNQACAAFVPSYHSKELVPFLWKFAIANKPRFIAAGQGGAQPNISQTLIKQFPINIPPLAEQRRIVAKLDALNANSSRACIELARIKTLVSRYKQAVLSKAFSGELTREWRERVGIALTASQKIAIAEAVKHALSSRRGARTNTHQVNFEAIADIPTSWADGIIAIGSEMVVGFAFKSEWFRAAGIKLLRGANIAPGAINWSDLKCLDTSIADEFSKYLIEEDDIVLAMDRPVISTGLKVARVTCQDAGCLLVQRVTRFRATEFVTQSFLWWLLNSQMFLSHSLQRATGSDLPHISGDDIATCPIPIPPKEEQHEIVRRIESAFAKIDRLAAEAKRALELVGKLDEAILAKAFRGELVPQHENDESAERLLARIVQDRTQVPRDSIRRRMRAPLKQSPRHSELSSTVQTVKGGPVAKSRLDEDVFERPYLANLIKRDHISDVQVLFTTAELPVADFYKQLAWEISTKHISDSADRLSAL
ncbi:UNVERIFIED_ORG: type I restriction enzyme S subunit [Rhizobium esperanzae]